MAGFKLNLKSLYENALDWVWPHLAGRPVPAPDDSLSIRPGDEDILAEVEHVIESRSNQADERLRTVETKLVALLTLTSVLSAAVTASFAATSILEIQKSFPLVPMWFTLILVFYIAMHLLRSLWATVSGLIRRDYKQLSFEDIIPKDKENKISYKIRILNGKLNHVKWNEWVVDQKVNEMAVAHRALRNALVATGGIIVVALATVVLKLL